MIAPDQAARVLTALGVDVGEAPLRVEARDERCCARLPQGRIAFFATSPAGVERLRRERRILRLIEARCSFRAPRVLLESDDGEVDVRAMVPGTLEPWTLYETLRGDRSLAASVGRAVGVILAEQHTRIKQDDLEGWLPERPSWPEPAAWILERLLRVVDDAQLLADASELLARHDQLALPDNPVLVHADVGLHNLAIDADPLRVHGIFDYGDAALADRHLDFRYLVFDLEGTELLDAARSIYEPATGQAISHERVLLLNAACALSYLAFRDGTPPDARSCGRTLAQDLNWTRTALARARRRG